MPQYNGNAIRTKTNKWGTYSLDGRYTGIDGAITPAYEVSVTLCASDEFTIAANSNYTISDVLLDGVKIGASLPVNAH